MPTLNRDRIRRRKQARDETKQIVEQYAASMGMYIIDMKNVRPETLSAAVVLLCDAREQLPPEEEAIIYSENYELNIQFVLSNVPTCPHCGCAMCRIG